MASLWHLIWQFSQLHAHKAAVLVLFAISLYEISAAYFILLIFLIVITPLPVLHRLTYPIITLLLGGLALAKAVYQLPMISVPQLTIGDCIDNATAPSSCGNTDNGFNVSRTFVTRYINFGWFGLNKTDNPALYVAAPLLASLVLCFWFTAKRHQEHSYQTTQVQIQSWETGSLFLDVSLHDVHTTLLGSFKFLVNHFFESYGVEVCLVMFVAIRDDIYAVVFVLILGLLLIVPGRVLRPLWFPVGIVLAVLLLWRLLSSSASLLYSVEVIHGTMLLDRVVMS